MSVTPTFSVCVMISHLKMSLTQLQMRHLRFNQERASLGPRDWRNEGGEDQHFLGPRGFLGNRSRKTPMTRK